MYESPEDLVALQRLLDESYDRAGPHLREVITPERRLTAGELAAELTGMRLLVLATVTADGRPISGSVDGFFYRGSFWFGSSPASLRFRHIRSRPAVSATHLPGEHLSVSVHGTAEPIDVGHVDHAHFRKTLIDYYRPRFGPEWEQMLDDGAAYARIRADRLFTFSMPEA